MSPNSSYYVNGKNKINGKNNFFYDKDKNYISKYAFAQGTGTFETPNNCEYVRFNGTIVELVEVSFTRGSTAPTTYVEHEGHNYQLSLGDIELNSSPDGTIRDQIVGSPDNWFKREYIGKVVLKSNSEFITSFSKSSRTTFDIYAMNTTIFPASGIKRCTHFTCGNGISMLENLGGAWFNAGVQMLVVFAEYGTTTLQDFKDWLDANEVIVWYQKAEYTDIPITDTTLINQLNDIYNNAHSYNGVTNITTTYEEGNEQMYLDASALMDISKKIDTLTNAIIELGGE